MTVRVITDTGASLPPDVAATAGVRLVPLTVTVGGRSYRETEVDLQALGDARATTSGPLPAEFVTALDGATDGAVIVTLAAALSSTHGAARAAASLADVPLVVVDSNSAAGAQALVALAAADAANAGCDLDTVAAAARSAANNAQLAGFLANLDGLARSGRAPGLAAYAVRATGTQFMFRLRNGKIRPVRPAINRDAALDRLAVMCAQSRASTDAVTDVVLLGKTAGLDERLAAAALTIGRHIVGRFGAAVTLYTGEDVTGLAWRHRTPE
jgi:DegV family protein with EDD domain